MTTIKCWYYGTLFLFFGWLFDVALYLSDDWEKVQGLLKTTLYYEAKLGEHWK